ncbi:MAG: ParB/RepB/Spo0J family partition protein [Verrucomicrobia bacterium]|nr:ParB/RepB/Spo0J family partition protein [Verrucomicrobiota bacterium]
MSKAKPKLTSGDKAHNAKRCADYRKRKKAGLSHAPTQLLALDDIVVVANPRKKFPEGAQTELVESMREHGILQPLVVRHLPAGKFELIAGERRLRAARTLGWLVIPCSVRTMDERQAAVLRVLENLQRLDLSPIEEAQGFEALRAEGMKVGELAALVHKTRQHVHRTLRLLKLPESVQTLLEDGSIDRSIAAVIASIEDDAKRAETAEAIASRGMSYRQALAFLRNNAGKPLDGVAWDLFDAELEPAAGSCDACPKRCGDVCPDIDCWERKRRGWLTREREKFQAQGVEVIDEEKVFGPRGELKPVGVVVLDDEVDPGFLKPSRRDEMKRKTWDELIPGVTAPVVLRGDGTVTRVLPIDAAYAAAAKAGHKGLFTRTPGGDYEQQERERRLKAREAKIEEAILRAQIASDLGAIDRGLVVAEDFFKVPEVLSEALLTEFASEAPAAEYLDPELMPESWKLAKHADEGGELHGGSKWRLAVAIMFFGDGKGPTTGGLQLVRGLGIELPKISTARVEAIRAEIEGREPVEEPAEAAAA